MVNVGRGWPRLPVFLFLVIAILLLPRNPIFRPADAQGIDVSTADGAAQDEQAGKDLDKNASRVLSVPNRAAEELQERHIIPNAP